ncbi:M15 family metallopeptidase [Photobacterium leiognathi]|uniref:M15 family metallopeptidase n=1 Tax=Photobacterium leiognathi TaxID=553611 RepID=UPI002981DC1E|nr:M15 family metallopeptidase [Photobacterium leiognathi]
MMNKQLIKLGLAVGMMGVVGSATAATVTSITSAECQAMSSVDVMSTSAPVQCQRLKKVTFKYRDFSGRSHSNGQIIVMDAVAPYVGKIFDELYQVSFPIHKAVPIEKYRGDDTKSMTDNNTSAFNYRPVEGTSSLSLHAYGAAIDLNPVQNPFVTFARAGQAKYSPVEGTKYANREIYRYGKPDRKGMAETVVGIFARNGFLYWGGFWDSPIDYQHFQLSKDMAVMMSQMSAQQATLFFKHYVEWYNSCSRMYPKAYSQYKFNDYTNYLKHKLGVSSLNKAYQANPAKVMAQIEQVPLRSEICVKR